MTVKKILATTATVMVLAGPVTGQVEDYRDIQYPKLGEFEIPRPEIFELDNGLTVLLLEDDELPLVRVTARIRTGSVYEPKEKTGLAAITGAVQRTGGTVSMTGDEVDDFLEARAASVETATTRTRWIGVCVPCSTRGFRSHHAPCCWMTRSATLTSC